MSLAEALEATVPGCKFKRWLSTLEETDRIAAVAALLGNDYTINQLFEVFSKYGLTVTETTLRYHRQGRCRKCGLYE